MDASRFLDQLLQSGKELAERGRDLAEDKLGVPDHGNDRDAMVSGLKKGAVAGGLFALLLGTRGGRRMSGKALKYGSLAALGGVAFKAYQGWQNKAGQPSELPPPPPVGDLAGPAANQRSLALIRAMMAAAKADGHVDKGEQARITEEIQKLELDDETRFLLHAELDRPLDVGVVAAGADTPMAAAEIYLASRIVVDVENLDEREYLNKLAEALKLSPELVDQLEQEAVA